MDQSSTAEDTTSSLEITVPAERGSVSLVSDLVDHFLRVRLRADESDGIGRELLLVVQEALTNVIRHARSRRAGTTTVRVEVDTESVVMRFRDIGPDFEPAKVPTPQLERPKPGGYGLFLMRGLMDRLSVRTLGEERELVLERRRRPETGR